ncbi:hypothetical protein BO82DRAFT_329764 [Aspergillus uvarum CBS 121591]|uniref:Prolyl 4-hydroxylase alpha subunit domain-containing protein n=1 Tax=Aspergillus uvarum CBS 121591 TaxID=1448315 RepID=A0A319CEZ0_9EURO|nr:hypothetical protein BO82DRAFT_329764 [Aspergillus uvarum CBS 121591]PYH84416.1 hypothetical protein BO82DRAFT_329764 [Aspergillus uvarum CBS 121591]
MSIVIPLHLHVSGSYIHGVSLGDNNQFFSIGSHIPVASTTTQTPLPTEHPSSFLKFIQPDSSIDCPDHEFQAYLIAESPRMIYIESFLREDERLHLLEKSEPGFTPASIYNPETNEATTDNTYRRSVTASLPRDPVTRCIESRAAAIQHWNPNMALEPLTVQRYEKDGFFLHHLDALPAGGFPNRRTTLNIWLDGNCTGGGTHFPMIPRWEDPALCDRVLDCDCVENGTVFRPIAGNALFWENIGPDGSVYEEMVHAGLPVTGGLKVGLNVWSWIFREGDERVGGFQRA